MEQQNIHTIRNHSRVPLSGISSLLKMKAAETPDTNARGWHQAFTLIELLVVVLIVGILSAIALPQYQKAVARTRATEALINLQNLYNAEKVYFLANNMYTTDMTQLDIEFPTSEYYQFSVLGPDDGWRIYAYRRNQSVPTFEYALSSTNRWCVASTTNAIQRSTCATFGTEDHASERFNATYYKMN